MNFYSNTKSKAQAGFTLIELLIVSAIIAMLAAVVLTSLQRARRSARDASAIGQASVIRTEAEVEFMSSGNSYDALCSGGTITDAMTKLTTDANGTPTCSDSVTGYSLFFTLNTSTNVYCVDHTGFAGEVAAGSAPSAGQDCSGAAL